MCLGHEFDIFKDNLVYHTSEKRYIKHKEVRGDLKI